MIKFLFDSPNISILAGSIFTNLAGVLKEIKPFETFLSDQMAKHVGLIPSLDGGLYQVNGDKVEVSWKNGLMRMDSCKVTLSSTVVVYDIMINRKANMKHKLNFVILSRRSLCVIFFCMSFSFSQEVITANNFPVIHNNALLTKAFLQAHLLKSRLLATLNCKINGHQKEGKT